MPKAGSASWYPRPYCQGSSSPPGRGLVRAILITGTLPLKLWCELVSFALALLSTVHRSPLSLGLFDRKRIHNRRPSRIYSFEDEHSIIDGAVHEKSLRHVRFVRVKIDKPPRSQNRCRKQNGELPLLCHFTGPYVAFYGGFAFRSLLFARRYARL